MFMTYSVGGGGGVAIVIVDDGVGGGIDGDDDTGCDDDNDFVVDGLMSVNALYRSTRLMGIIVAAPSGTLPNTPFTSYHSTFIIYHSRFTIQQSSHDSSSIRHI